MASTLCYGHYYSWNYDWWLLCVIFRLHKIVRFMVFNFLFAKYLSMVKDVYVKKHDIFKLTTFSLLWVGQSDFCCAWTNVCVNGCLETSENDIWSIHWGLKYYQYLVNGILKCCLIVESIQPSVDLYCEIKISWQKFWQSPRQLPRPMWFYIRLGSCESDFRLSLDNLNENKQGLMDDSPLHP